MHENKIPHLYDASLIRFDYTDKTDLNGRKIAVQKMTTRNLKFPYYTNCINYEKESQMYKSTGECMERCLTSSIMRKYGKIINYYSTTTNFTKEIPDHFNIEFEIIADINSHCSKNCHEECTNVRYTMYLRDIYDPLFKKFFKLDIEADLPAISIQLQPYLEFLPYLIFVASVVGLWLGFTLYSTPLDMIYKLFNAIKRKN